MNSYEGLQGHIPELITPEIEIWDFQFPGSATTITISIPEFTCICPKTGLPDFAEIKVEYQPENYCLELKSLKEYVLFFREVGIFHEHLVNKFLTDTVQACKPKWMKISGIFNPRGGIQTTAVSTYNI
jgi:7-cyano-7-deazaguanine reductase